MYGIVNKAIHGLVIENYGEEVWEKIKKDASVDVDFFLSNEPYPDEMTYKLAASAAKTLNTTIDNVLISFGEYWILKTGQHSYGSLMKAGGSDFKEFLINLPNFHSRVMLIYPNLTPPEFSVSDIQENSLNLHYYSSRGGLKYFVYGLVKGLGTMFKVGVEIEILQSREDGFDHEIFKVKW